MSFIKSIQEQVHQRWLTAEKRWTEDEATRNTDGHETVYDFVLKHYGRIYREMELQVRVDYGDNWIDLFHIKVGERDRLLLVCFACDGHEVREGIA